MERLRTLNSYQIFKTKNKKFKKYSGWCHFKGLSNDTTLMQIQSGRTVPLSQTWRHPQPQTLRPPTTQNLPPQPQTRPLSAPNPPTPIKPLRPICDKLYGRGNILTSTKAFFDIKVSVLFIYDQRRGKKMVLNIISANLNRAKDVFWLRCLPKKGIINHDTLCWLKISPQKFDKWRVTIGTGGIINDNLWHPHFKNAGLRVLQWISTFKDKFVLFNLKGSLT